MTDGRSEQSAEGFVEIFGSGFRLPERVCIVAPGPLGAPYHGAIPTDWCVIAVAKAVLIPGLRPDIWMMNHSQQDWFAAAAGRFRGTCIFGSQALVGCPPLGEKAARYYYRSPPGEPLEVDRVRPVDGYIRVGASISACAVQVAANFGARELLLCGVDMSGDAYWDGTVNVQASHGYTWPAAARLNRLIGWLVAERGMTVASLSPTRLDVPVLSYRGP
jgi:hypothetical protein